MVSNSKTQSTAEKFDKMKEYYTAIQDIDRISKSDSIDKIDDIIIAVQGVKKSDFDTVSTKKIIEGFREALVKMYKDISSSITDIIDDSNKNDVVHIRVEDGDYINKF